MGKPRKPLVPLTGVMYERTGLRLPVVIDRMSSREISVIADVRLQATPRDLDNDAVRFVEALLSKVIDWDAVAPLKKLIGCTTLNIYTKFDLPVFFPSADIFSCGLDIASSDYSTRLYQHVQVLRRSTEQAESVDLTVCVEQKLPYYEELLDLLGSVAGKTRQEYITNLNVALNAYTRIVDFRCTYSYDFLPGGGCRSVLLRKGLVGGLR